MISAGFPGLALLTSISMGYAQHAPVPIGTLSPFYRGTQLQGHLPGHGLFEIPDYLTSPDVEVSYRKHTHLTKEVPFADSFSINRFLGGYSADMVKQSGLWDDQLGQASFDYVVRGSDGPLETRPGTIETHLQPYLDAGYSLNQITINIENVPWAIALDSGKTGSFGQRNPPRDLKDWVWTIERFAEDLKALYGPAAIHCFKIGNEYDTRKSFDGSAQEFFDLYSSSHEVLRRLFPESDIAPGEFSRNGRCDNRDVCVYDTQEFVAEAQRRDAPPAYIPRSLHAFQNRPGSMPSETVQRAVDSYARLGKVTPEIHQLGLLAQPFGGFAEFGSDQGPRRAAWEFQVLMGLQERLQPRRVFHWGGFFTFPGSEVRILNGAGFLRLFLDRYLGARLYRLPVSADASNTEVMAIGFETAAGWAIIVSSFSPEPEDGTMMAALDLNELLPGVDLDEWRFIRSTGPANVFAEIRRDLEADSNVKPEFDECPSCTARPQLMSIDPGDARRLVMANWPRYQESIKAGLRWRSFAELPYRLPSEPGTLMLMLELPRNELLVLESPR
jgi:hypothetical protein